MPVQENPVNQAKQNLPSLKERIFTALKSYPTLTFFLLAAVIVLAVIAFFLTEHVIFSKNSVFACKPFADLGNFKATITKTELDKIIAERKRHGEENINSDGAMKYACGRAKIEQAAKVYGVSVSKEEINAQLELSYKEFGSKEGLLAKTPLEELKPQVRGVLLEKKLEEKIVVFRTGDAIMVRWDFVKDWDKNIQSRQDEAKKILDPIKSELSKGVSSGEATKSATFDKAKFGIGGDSNFKFSAATANLNASVLPLKGVSDILCDDRSCTVYRTTGGNDGKYSTFKEFMGDLKEW